MTDQIKCEKCTHVHDKEDGTCKCGCREKGDSSEEKMSEEQKGEDQKY